MVLYNAGEYEDILLEKINKKEIMKKERGE